MCLLCYRHVYPDDRAAWVSEEEHCSPCHVEPKDLSWRLFSLSSLVNGDQLVVASILSHLLDSLLEYDLGICFS